MPRIELPPDEPDDIYDYEPPKPKISSEEFMRVQNYLDIASWKCSECGIMNFGHNKKCVYCWIRRGVVIEPNR